MPRHLLRLALLLAIASSCAERGGAEVGGEGEKTTAPAAPAAAPTTAAAPRVGPEAMAERVVAAVAAGDVDQVLALMSPTGRAELGDLTRAGFRRLRAELARRGVDLGQATITRVEASGGDIDLVDVHLDHGGTPLRMHFSALAIDDRYELVGLAEWVR
jgi:hypothetical protein